MGDVNSEGGGATRERQRQRTRRAIVTAAAALLGREEQPSVAEVAEAAGVSRRTVYMYFPTHEQLLADAALEAARELIEPEFVQAEDGEARLDAMVRAMQRNALTTEPLGRTIIRHTIEAKPVDVQPGKPRRGYRRVEWIESALEPVRDELSPADYERLVSVLTLLVGWESMIVLRDIRALSPAEVEDVCAWAAGVLLAASHRARHDQEPIA
jgi:AcrR family transcriptional regulator